MGHCIRLDYKRSSSITMWHDLVHAKLKDQLQHQKYNLPRRITMKHGLFLMFNGVRVPGVETQHTGKGMEFVSDIFSWTFT